jgi:uncharacterized membrane protein
MTTTATMQSSARLARRLALLVGLAACAGEAPARGEAAATDPATARPDSGVPAPPDSSGAPPGAAADTVPLDSLPTLRAREIEEEARRRGVDFRGVGQEPGWIVEIDEGVSIVFNGDYGETRATTGPPVREVDEASGRIRYRARAAAGDVVVSIARSPCQDAMSGARFEATVTVSYAGREYRGCGQSLGGG